ncbi:MAG: hypothetical protein ACREI9_07555 [Nitrospiraceae bacterium]
MPTRLGPDRAGFGACRRAVTAWGIVLAFAGLCGGAAGPAVAQSAKMEPLVERLGPSGSVNWATGWIKATGLGIAPQGSGGGAGQAMAQRAAFAVAVRNLLETVKGIRVDSTTLVDNYMMQNDVIKTQVTGFVKGAQIAQTTPHPDGSVEVTVKVPMYGVDSLMTPILPEKGFTSQDIPPESPDGYTGMVIDARGLGLKPACFPSVVDDKGQVVYGPQTVDKAAAEKDGMMHYMTAPKGADLSSLFGEDAYIISPVQAAPAVVPREGRRPLKIKGMDKAGALKANIIISSDDAKKIREDASMSGALKRSRVTVVTDPLIGGMEGRLPAFDRLLAAAVPDASH